MQVAQKEQLGEDVQKYLKKIAFHQLRNEVECSTSKGLNPTTKPKHKMNSLLAKIANELIMTGVAKNSAARIACFVVIKQLTENGMDLPKAFDLVFGIDAYKNFAGEIFETINA